MHGLQAPTALGAGTQLGDELSALVEGRRGQRDQQARRQRPRQRGVVSRRAGERNGLATELVDALGGARAQELLCQPGE